VSEYPHGTPPTYAPDDRTPAQIESDLAATRTRLSGTVDSLVDTLNPKNIARRLVGSIVGPFTHDDGTPDVKKIAPIAGGAVAAVGLLVGLRLLVRKKR
jgi:Protein of unknown function (DUF3618)